MRVELRTLYFCDHEAGNREKMHSLITAITNITVITNSASV